MSTIIATTLSNGSVFVPTATVVNGSAKAWAATPGSATILDSLNTSSITDNGVGDYNFNWSSAMANGNYAVTTSRNWNGVFAPDSYSTTTCRSLSREAAGTTKADSRSHIAIHGDLA